VLECWSTGKKEEGDMIKADQTKVVYLPENKCELKTRDLMSIQK